MSQCVNLLLVLLQVYSEVCSQTIDLHMPGVQPAVDDAHLCHTLELNEDSEVYINGIDWGADTGNVHHMVVSACEQPGSMKSVWTCGNFGAPSRYPEARLCRGRHDVLYMWTWNTTSFSLPKDIAFAVGGKTIFKYLILQIHYKDVSSFNPPLNLTDHTGVTLETQTEKPRFRASFLYLTSIVYLKPHSTTYIEGAMVYDQDITITPFLYRVHTHHQGRVVSAYRVRNGQWTEIGRRDPQLPQLFVNTTTHLTIKKGDILAFRCTMENDYDHVVKYGPKNSDEMCSFFMMYYTEGGELLKKNRYASTKVDWTWKDFHGDDLALQNMPETVSTVPGTTTPILETPRR